MAIKLPKAINAPTCQELHNPRYSVIANPDSNTFQNCTERTLNLLMAALYDTDDMARIKANTQAHFKPQVVKISPLKRLRRPLVLTVPTESMGTAAPKLLASAHGQRHEITR